jgi:aryl sulfotransferase
MVLHHLETAWTRRHEPNIHLLHYADLRRDPAGELHRLGDALGFDITPQRAAELAAEATLERMRERADEVAPSASKGIWRDPSRFLRTGGAGEWQQWMAPDDEGYWRLVAAHASPDLARWAHEGAPALVA